MPTDYLLTVTSVVRRPSAAHGVASAQRAHHPWAVDVMQSAQRSRTHFTLRASRIVISSDNEINVINKTVCTRIA